MNTIEQLYAEFLESEGITTDSRKAGKNMIFCALNGERFDGNEFANEAIQKGCRLAIVDNPSLKGEKFFSSENSLETLQQLAVFHREKIKTTIIGITGSNGKTTTKELINSVLSSAFSATATKGNLNNHIGVPISLLGIKNEEFAVIEMGANHPGEIGFLSNIARPDCGLITNIGKAHLEGFGSFEGVKKTKSELYKFLESHKHPVFINGDNPVLLELSDSLKTEKIFYQNGKNPICTGEILSSNEKLSVKLSFPPQHEQFDVEMNLTGSYNLENIVAAAAIGKYFNMSMQQIKLGLQAYTAGMNRSELFFSGKNHLLLDAYNANPTSMAGSISHFLHLKHNRKILILGDMFELGDYAREEHRNILKMLQYEQGIEVFLSGKEFYALKDEFNFHFFSDTDKLYHYLSNKKTENAYILLKGSRAVALEKLKEIL